MSKSDTQFLDVFKTYGLWTLQFASGGTWNKIWEAHFYRRRKQLSTLLLLELGPFLTLFQLYYFFSIALSTTGLTMYFTYCLFVCPYSPLTRTEASRKQGLSALLFRAASPVSSPALSMAVTRHLWLFRFNLKFINTKQN